MGDNDVFRDYLYVSTRKIARMMPTQKPGLMARIKDLRVKLGPLEAGVGLDAGETQRQATALIPQIERALNAGFGFRYWTDPDLQVGHWVLVEGLPMAYGVADMGDGQAAMFIGDNIGIEPYHDLGEYLRDYRGGEPPHFLILGGSVEHLLDRTVVGTSAVSPSVLIGIERLLKAAASEAIEEGPAVSEESDLRELGETGLAHWYLKSILGEHGLEPLTAVARAAQIMDTRYSAERIRMIVGSPLYVAFHIPD